MGLPAILTIAAAVLATGETDPSYAPDLGQTVQTVVIPEPSQWKAVNTQGSRRRQLCVQFRQGMMLFSNGPVSGVADYSVEAAAGPARFRLGDWSGTCRMECSRLVIYLPSKDATERDSGWLLVLEREKP